MSFKVTFHSDSAFKASFTPQADMKAKFGDFIEVPVADYYDGEYTVTPKANTEQTLATRGLTMRDNVTVYRVPYFETSNPDGETVYIAAEA